MPPDVPVLPEDDDSDNQGQDLRHEIEDPDQEGLGETCPVYALNHDNGQKQADNESHERPRYRQY